MIELEDLKQQLRAVPTSVNNFKLLNIRTQYVYELLMEAYIAEVKSRGHVFIHTQMIESTLMAMARFMTDPKDCRFSIMLCGIAGNGKSFQPCHHASAQL